MRPKTGDSPSSTNGVETFSESGGTVVFGHIYDDLSFLVENGEGIYYDLKHELPRGVLQTYLLGVLMATALRQRGYLVLHACSVAKEDKAIAFVGESGWGKSTLAEYFCQRGYTLLNDDVLALQIGDESSPQVIPGYPQIRLRSDAGKHLRQDYDSLPEVNAVANKRAVTPRRFPDQPLPLRKVYMLDPTYAQESRTEPFDRHTALLRLLQHTRVTNLLKKPAFKAQQLRQCERLVHAVPINRLHRARGLSRLGEIYDLVERDMAEDTEVLDGPSPG